MAYFLLGSVVLVLVLLLLSWGGKAVPRDVLRSLKWLAIGIAGAVLALVLVTKNIAFLWGLCVAAVPWIARLRWLHGLWRQARGPRPAGQRPTQSRMSRAEALEALGLEDGATQDEIRAAYHRLMKQVHPDVGGSAYLAGKLNEARDVLLG